jgi:XapX domain-containing protein
MKPYLLSLGAGLLVGAIYGLVNVRSPAPPVVALVGLLGILIGEQVPPVVKGLWQRQSVAHAWFTQVKPCMFGPLPKAAVSEAGAPRGETVAPGAAGGSSADRSTS